MKKGLSYTKSGINIDETDRIMEFTIRHMKLSDFEDAHTLWKKIQGICLDEEDTRESIEIFLDRNPGLCFVAVAGGKIIGTLLCGHDGRRGIIRHLVVDPEFRGRGIASSLVHKCLSVLAGEGISKCNTFVLDSNVEGRHFWEHIGFRLHENNFRLMQILTK